VEAAQQPTSADAFFVAVEEPLATKDGPLAAGVARSGVVHVLKLEV
jgi:hypothetical protein